MVFLISSVYDFSGFFESYDDNCCYQWKFIYGDNHVHEYEFFTELHVFAYTGGPNLYDWCDYEEAWYFYVDSVAVYVFPM